MGSWSSSPYSSKLLHPPGGTRGLITLGRVRAQSQDILNSFTIHVELRRTKLDRSLHAHTLKYISRMTSTPILKTPAPRQQIHLWCPTFIQEHGLSTGREERETRMELPLSYRMFWSYCKNRPRCLRHCTIAPCCSQSYMHQDFLHLRLPSPDLWQRHYYSCLSNSTFETLTVIYTKNNRWDGGEGGGAREVLSSWPRSKMTASDWIRETGLITSH